MRRRLFIQTLAAVATTSALPLLAQTAKPQVEVWKDASCGCCKDWIAPHAVQRFFHQGA
jgi:hypothetical protein